MKSGRRFFEWVMFLVVVSAGCAADGDSPRSEGPYLGQTPPGNTAEVFAPGLVSTDSDEILYGFHDDGALLFFERTPVGFDDDWIRAPVFRTEIDAGVWTTPRAGQATGRPWFHEYPDAAEGTVVLFPWRERLDGGGSPQNIDIWRVVKRSDAWSEPERLAAPVNTEFFDSWPSLTDGGVLYFFSNREGGLGGLDLYRSELGDFSVGAVENLGEVINTEHHDHDPFIAPDESYLVWCSDRPGGLGENDLYVSFRRSDGKWTVPQNLGEGVNTPADDTRPSVTADGKYLFFVSDASGNRDIYWIDAGFLEGFRPLEGQ